jgi:hypothetical protein
MILNLITLATVKTQLGISDTTYDADITAMIPLVSNDVRRILNTNFDTYTLATITSRSAELSIGDVSFNQIDDSIYSPRFNMGQVIYSPAFAEDTYIQSYDPDTAIYTASNTASTAGAYLYPTLQISQWPAVSKMIFYKISKQSTTAATTEKLSAISYGNVSKTFADNEINKRFDYPQIFIDELGPAFVRVG